MTLNQLEYFQTVARLEHLGRAAEILHISQPSVSVAIAKLEEELGAILFQRTGRNITLTDAGKLFLEHTDRILDYVALAKEQMRMMHQQAEQNLRIGYIAPLAASYIPQTLRGFLAQAENKDVHIVFEHGNTDDLLAGLRSGLYDLVFCSEPAQRSDLVCLPVIQQPIVIVTPLGHPLAGKHTVPLCEVARYPLISYTSAGALAVQIQRMMADNNCCAQIMYRAPDENAISALVEQGFGIALMAKTPELSERKVHIVAIAQGDYTRTIYLARCKHKPPTNLTQRFMVYLGSRE